MSNTVNLNIKDPNCNINVNGANIKELVNKGKESIAKEGGFKSTLKNIGMGLLKGLGFVLQGLLKLIGGVLNFGGNAMMQGRGMMPGMGMIPGMGMMNGMGGLGRGLLGGLLGMLANGLGNNLFNGRGGMFGNILGGFNNDYNNGYDFSDAYRVPSYGGRPLYDNYNYGDICSKTFGDVNDKKLFSLLADKMTDLAKMVGWNTKVNRDLTLPMAKTMFGADKVVEVMGKENLEGLTL